MKKLRRLLKALKSLIPQTLPQGRADFDSWASDIIELSGLPDNDSMRFALASIIIQLRTSRDRAFGRFKPALFVRELKLGAASEVASSVMYEMKQKQKAREDEAKAAASNTSNEPKTG